MKAPDKSIEQVALYKRGDFLQTDDVNALINAAKRSVFRADGFADSTGDAQATKTRQRAVYHGKNTTGEIIPPYSIFGIYLTGEADSEPTKGNLRIIGRQEKGSPYLMLTNGPFEIPVDGQLECQTINFETPVLLECNEDSIPEFGMPCGPDFDTFQICAHRHGLVCVSPPIVKEAGSGGSGSSNSSSEVTGTFIWCLRTREPIKVVGCVTSEITSYNPETKELGRGHIRVRYRDDKDDDKLLQVSSPATPSADYIVEVWNYRTTAYPVNMLIGCVETLGIGLTVEFDLPNRHCASSSSGGSSQSSKSDAPSSESGSSQSSSSESASSFSSISSGSSGSSGSSQSGSSGSSQSDSSGSSQSSSSISSKSSSSDSSGSSQSSSSDSSGSSISSISSGSSISSTSSCQQPFGSFSILMPCPTRVGNTVTFPTATVVINCNGITVIPGAPCGVEICCSSGSGGGMSASNSSDTGLSLSSDSLF